MKILKFDDISFVEKLNGFQLLTVALRDKKGNEYSWAPKWDEVKMIISCAVVAEEKNKGKGWVDLVEIALWVLARVASSFNCRHMALENPEKHYKFTERDVISVTRADSKTK